MTYDPSAVARLADEVVRHRRLYEAGRPEISDAKFDAMESALRQIAPDHPALNLVGTDKDSGGAKIAHAEPMLSLDKTYDRDELISWMGEEPLVGTLKVDGVSISLLYEKGRLKLAKTRGNGQVGEDVTAKVRWVADALPRLKDEIDVEIRGELYCTETRFLELSERFAALGLERPTSARNIIAGLLGRKTHVDLARSFNFFAFSVRGLSGFKRESEAVKWLGAQGFALPEPEILEGAEAVDAYLEKVRRLMDEGEVQLDGAVFTYDLIARQNALGNTSHHPRYKLSFKWQGETALSTIDRVAWATSRLGIVTPVAVIKPVFLSGAEITNVTLHNAAHVKAFSLKCGDVIEIVRSGEVIPKFLRVVTPASGEPVLPKSCDACGTSLVFDDVRLKCPNTEGCPAQQLGAILNWIRCAEIDDLSDKRLVPLMEAGLVKSIPDLYKLAEKDFYVIPQTKEKMAAKLFANVQKSRRLPLARFLNGLGLEGCGLTTWEKLLSEMHTLAALRTADEARIAAIEGFAERSAEQVVKGLAARSVLIDALLAAGVVPDDSAYAEGAAGAKDGPLAGKTIVITGALSRPRGEIEKAIKAAGGRTGSSVSKATHAVVTDDPTSSSSKMKKARELEIPVWSESELLRVLGVTD